MVHFVEALAIVNSNLPEIFSQTLIAASCREVGHKWRNSGPLRPWVVILFFVMQVLKGNTACTGVSMLGARKFSATAYCKARKRLPLALFEALLEKVAALAGATREPWRGLNLFFADGTGCSMSETDDLAAFFGLPSGQKPGLGSPVAHLLHSVDAATGMILQTIISPYATGDLTHFSELLPKLGEKALLVADRGFAVYGAFALCEEHGVHMIMRADRRKVCLKGCGAIGPGDRLVVCRPSKHAKRSKFISDALWNKIKHGVALREITCDIHWSDGTRMELILLTSLLNPVKYPAAEIVELYLRRWEIETNFRHLKRTLNLDHLKGKSVDVVKKEILMHCIGYNLVRQVMLAAAGRKPVGARRISFVDALRWLLECRDPAALERLIVNPIRHRKAPRVVKRRRQQFPLMTKQRHEYPSGISVKSVVFVGVMA